MPSLLNYDSGRNLPGKRNLRLRRLRSHPSPRPGLAAAAGDENRPPAAGSSNRRSSVWEQGAAWRGVH